MKFATISFSQLFCNSISISGCNFSLTIWIVVLLSQYGLANGEVFADGIVLEENLYLSLSFASSFSNFLISPAACRNSFLSYHSKV